MPGHDPAEPELLENRESLTGLQFFLVDFLPARLRMLVK